MEKQQTKYSLNKRLPLFKIIFTLIYVLLSLHNNNAQNKPFLSLEQAVDLALEHNNEIKNKRLDIEAQKYAVKSIIAAGLPQINASSSLTHNVEIPSAVFPDFITPSIYNVLIDEGLLSNSQFKPGAGGQAVQFGAPSQIVGTINLNQLVFDGRYFLGLKAAKEVVQMTKLLAIQTELEVKEQTMKNYFRVLLLEKNLTLLKKSKNLVSNLYDQTSAMYVEGMTEKLDVDRLLLSKNNIENQIRTIIAERIVARMYLNLILGQKIDEKYELTSSMENTGFTSPASNLFDQKDRIERKILDQSILLNEMEIKGLKVTRYPSIYLNAQHLQNSFANNKPFEGLGKDWFPGSLYTLSLNVPLFDGFNKRNDIQKLKIKSEQLDNQQQYLENSLNMQYESAIMELTTQRESLVFLESTVNLAKKIFETERTKFEEGLGSSFELVNAQNEFVSASIQLSNGQYNFITKYIDYKKSIGKL